MIFSDNSVVIGSGVATLEFLAKNSPLEIATSDIVALPGSVPFLYLARARIGSMWFFCINEFGFSGDGNIWNVPSVYSLP